MGGNLLKTWNLPEKRLGKTQYENLSKTIVNTFLVDYRNQYNREDANPNLQIGIAFSLREKESHGDLDIIVSIPEFGRHYWKNFESFPDYILYKFGYSPSRNSNVYSFPVEGFQVDVTFVEQENFQSSLDYCSWGDVGNLLGRIFHRMGLHYGHIGLSFWIRQGLFDNNCIWSDNDHIYEKTVLTKDMNTICEIGGFDYKVWKNGFDTEENAFEFVVNSKYFHKNLFAFENLNNINRVRNKKRPMYARFVEFVKDIPDKNPEFVSKENYALIFQQRFPQLREAIDTYRFQNSIKNCIKVKINGHLIKEMFPELEGQQIGNILSSIREEYSDVDLLKMSEAHAKTIIESACINTIEM